MLTESQKRIALRTLNAVFGGGFKAVADEETDAAGTVYIVVIDEDGNSCRFTKEEVLCH